MEPTKAAMALWPGEFDPAAPEGQCASLVPYLLPDERVRPCVMVCPGGGYWTLAPHEAEHVADWLNQHDFHAAVLRYRLGSAGHRHPAMIHDAQRGLRLLRHHSERWRIKPDGIGMIGFSAGGHLASSLAVHHARFQAPQDDLAASTSARPDAVVLGYPVIDMSGEMTHVGSRRNLLGDNPDPELCRLMSTHLHVGADTPPTFLWHTADDPGVLLGNSLAFATACAAVGVPVELHVFPQGAHGLGLADGWKGWALDPYVGQWASLCLTFLRKVLD